MNAFGAFFLFEKAFDSVSHKYLKVILTHFKFPQKLIDLIFKFLSYGKSCIKINGVYTESFTIERGVRQGDPLSGLLFVLALEPLLCTLYKDKYKFAPQIGRDKYHIPYTAFADDLTIFCRRSVEVIGIKRMLSYFETATGLKVNSKKTEIYHIHYNEPTICDWPVVRFIKILGIIFPTQNRMHIHDTIDKLHGQIAFWKRLKLPLYTKLVLLNTYTKFQYCLNMLDWSKNDISKVNKLIHWAMNNSDESDFIPSKRYNALFSAYRCSISPQQIGFCFEHKLWKAQLARLARIVNVKHCNMPPIFVAQNLMDDDPSSWRDPPPTIKKHVALWMKHKIKFVPFSSSPRSSTFTKSLNIKPPIIHPAPHLLPDLKEWPVIKRLKIPSSTKSFLLKVFMNGLPTFDRIAHYKGGTIACNLCGKYQVHCPVCDAPLSSFHFFSSIDRNIDLIFMNTLWKTFCTALHKKHLKLPALQHSAKTMFVHELRLAKTIFPKDYKIIEINLSKLNTNNMVFRYNLLDTLDTSQ